MAKRYLLPYVWELSPKKNNSLSSVLIGTIHAMSNKQTIRDYIENLSLDRYFEDKDKLYLESGTTIISTKVIIDGKLQEVDDEFLENHKDILETVSEKVSYSLKIPISDLDNAPEKVKKELEDDIGLKMLLELIDMDMGIESALIQYAEKHEILIGSLDFQPYSKNWEEYSEIAKNDLKYLGLFGIDKKTYRMFLPVMLPLTKLFKFLAGRLLYYESLAYISGVADWDSSDGFHDEDAIESIKEKISKENVVVAIGFLHCKGVLDALEEDFNIKRIPESVFGQNR